METPDGDSLIDQEVLRRLPAVHAVLEHHELAEARRVRSREAVVRAVRLAIDEARALLRAGLEHPADLQTLARRAREVLQSARPRLVPVINASGIVLHTGLGRAPLAEEAVEAVSDVARGYCNLELELETGERGQRTANVVMLFQELTGAAAATVVNNNAGATVLALRALAAGREVIVSRGQLVEIGGSFRLPEIFEASGAKLREVGTTNKTRLSDYQQAISERTAAILRVHHSNFKIVGFTEEAPLGGLVQLAHDHALLMIDDIGSGALRPGQPPGVASEPDAATSLDARADLVLFSGDKLLGGPQCGILLGTAAVIKRIESDPLMRALRVDKMTLAALEATLGLLASGKAGAGRIPLWRMLAISLPELQARAERFADVLRGELGLSVSLIAAESFIGGGSTPVQPLPTMAVAVGPPFPTPHASEGAWAQALRMGDPPVIPRTSRGCVLFDLRTVAPIEEACLLDAIHRSCHDRQLDFRPSPGWQTI
ncbi:MAG: L-seryl-tRNA(Sec) selenium transferase [Planctomycetaceae bacterium]|nr:L-seryl-tRNA(Sec) selenium transferase [Planctomycetaceae bacterium]